MFNTILKLIGVGLLIIIFKILSVILNGINWIFDTIINLVRRFKK